MFDGRLKDLRIEIRKTMKEVANELGIPYTTYVNYEKNVREPASDVLIKLSNYYKCSIDYLLGRTEERSDGFSKDIKPLKLRRFRLLGEIACGEPIFAVEEHEAYVMADIEIKADFCLVAKGDSMINARIRDGDIVFIKEMPTANDGDIVAVAIGDDATLKRFYFDKENQKLMLVAENPAYPPMVFVGPELEAVRVLGKAIYFTSAL